MNEKAPSKKRRCPLVLRILKWTVGVLVVLLIGLHFTAPALVTTVANKQLPKLLNVDAVLGSTTLNLIKGEVGLYGLALGQPDGFGEAPLLTLTGIHTLVPLKQAISGDPITIETLVVDELALNVIADTNGVLNISRLGSPKDPSQEKDAAPEEEPAGSVPELLLKNLTVRKLNIHYVDQRADREMNITNFDVNLRNLSVGPGSVSPEVPEIQLEYLGLENMLFSLLDGTNGVVTDAETNDVIKTTSLQTNATEVIEEPSPLPGVWLKAVEIASFTLDLQGEQNGINLLLSDFGLNAKDIVIGDVANAPASGEISAHTELRGEKASALLYLSGHLDRLEKAGPPSMQLALNLTGFELAVIKPVVKSDAVETLGIGMDLDFRLIVHPEDADKEQKLGGEWEVVTSGGVSLRNKIKGTITAPEANLVVLLQQLLTGAALHGVANVAGNVFSGGIQAFGTVADTGVEAIKGVGNTVKGAGMGLGKTAKGLFTLDLGKVKEGVLDTTVGTVADASHAVSDTAHAAGEGVKETAGTAMGKGAADPWLAEIPERAKKAQKKTDEWLAEVHPRN